jgi:serine/threonine protein kinase/tetratricopeptide (TPR) repeat protein
MSASTFKENHKQKPHIREVCSKCSKVRAQSGTGSLTAWFFDLNKCSCQPEKASESECQVNTEVPRQNLESLDDVKETDLGLGQEYKALDMIGQGGMGTVYRVRNKSLGKDFAVKILRSELATDTSAIKRFEQEANSAGELTHMNLLAVYGHGKTDTGAPYIIMDLLNGESLAEVLKKQNRLEPSRVLNISIQICDALAHAHMKGLIHRDLKPSNIMLVKNELSLDMVKVLDFGIAKLMPSTNRETQNLTQTGELFGSPSYMSPEQCFGCNVDARSDIYSLGCMMYEMLTGRTPFSGDNPIQTVIKHLNEEPAPIAKVAFGLNLPLGLEAVVMRCLEKDAAARYQSMDYLKTDLQLIAAGHKPKQPKKRITKPRTVPSPVVPTVVLAGVAMVGCPSIGTYGSNIPGAWHAVLNTILWLMGLSCASMWAAFLGQKSWLQIKKACSKTSAYSEAWAALTLIFPFLGALSIIAGIIGLWPKTSIRSQLPDHLILEAMLVTQLCFALAALPAIGWLLLKLASVLKLGQPLLKRFNFLVIVALCALTFLARPLIAWLPLETASGFDDCYNDPVKAAKPNPAYETAIFINPNFAEAYYRRGLRKQAAKLPSAIDDFTKAIDLKPSESLKALTLGARAQSYTFLGNYLAAIDDWSKKIEINLGKMPAFEGSLREDYESRAGCYRAIGQYENALLDCNKRIALCAECSSFYVERAQVFEALAKYDEALADYSKAIKLSPDSIEYYIARAGLYKKSGQQNKAIADYNAAVKLFDDKRRLNQYVDADDFFKVANAEKELGMEAQSQENLAQAKKLHPERNYSF